MLIVMPKYYTGI